MSADPTSGCNPVASTEPTPESVLGHLEFADKAAQMLRGARSEVVIFSHDLDRRIYSSESLVRLLRGFLLEHRRGRLRGIVQSPRSALQGAHRLVELARSLSSRMEFRECAEGWRASGEEYLIVDQRQLLIKGDRHEVEARYYADAPLLAREQLRQFENAWQASTVSREFSDLKL
ncbi:hypothetical protein [Hydrocarboniphaga effusa]|uniref:DUF7931 domain-containing protein n=2 Tax=Hydrocarboniphaga effusa TaxID=243629 RepID=I7Z8W9_9GAMM|nr:hypothetical protein [Hydrocarboniphaga effusa]EIT68112.1 hypothetical protein WQQ_45470 [Hydrocarboniphaga effusa AP103]